MARHLRQGGGIVKMVSGARYHEFFRSICNQRLRVAREGDCIRSRYVHGDRMRLLLLFLVLVVAIPMAGCVGTEDTRAALGMRVGEPARVEAATKVMHDRHVGVTRVVGPAVTFVAGTSYNDYMLTTVVRDREDKPADTFMITVLARFPRRVFLDAAFSEGRRLQTRVIDRERVCGSVCRTVETIGIMVSRSEMERYAQEGLTFRINGRRDDVVVDIPAAYFDGVLAVHRRAQGTG